MKRMLIFAFILTHVLAADILMITMGGTKSHKIPFMELAKGLIKRGHSITFLNGFPSDVITYQQNNGLHEITPPGLVKYIQKYTNWDLLGARMRGEMPLSFWDTIRYAFQSCDAMLGDAETKSLINRKFDLAILDGTYPECALAFVHLNKMPFMYINTVGFSTLSLAKAGNPGSYAVTPNFYSTFTDNMNIWQRAVNTGMHIITEIMHRFSMYFVHRVICAHFGSNIPHPFEISKNVSFILQNGHVTVSYPRALNPNVAEIACIHCKPAQPLPNDLEKFINSSGDMGFIYVSMGSSVKAANMPLALRHLFIKAFTKLPYHVLWKYEGRFTKIEDLPPNVKVSRWLPQQDILGHRKLRAFVTHGGLLSIYETVYHGIPVVSIPVFCDHDVNSAKTEGDGYAIKLDLKTLTANHLYKSIIKIVDEPQYRKAAKFRQNLLRDQRWKPLQTSIYWTEYVLRYKGAIHMQATGRNLSWMQYYLIDIAALYVFAILIGLFAFNQLLIGIKVFLKAWKKLIVKHKSS